MCSSCFLGNHFQVKCMNETSSCRPAEGKGVRGESRSATWSEVKQVSQQKQLEDYPRTSIILANSGQCESADTLRFQKVPYLLIFIPQIQINSTKFLAKAKNEKRTEADNLFLWEVIEYL